MVDMGCVQNPACTFVEHPLEVVLRKWISDYSAIVILKAFKLSAKYKNYFK